jgi:uncharacterized protein
MSYKVSELIESETKSIEFDQSCAGERLDDDYEIETPIVSKGRIWYENDEIHFEIHSVFQETFVCSRCMQECNRQRETTFRDEIACDDFIDSYGDTFDVCSIVIDQIVLQKPMKLLCSDDCKGLCDVCGCNLNQTQCDCKSKEYINPKFADLAKWLDASEKDEEV